MPRAAQPTFPWPSGWEYQDLSLEYEGSWSEALDELGKEGWMVVFAIHDESVKGDKEIRVLLMRPRSAPAPKAQRKTRAARSATSETGHEVVDESEDE